MARRNVEASGAYDGGLGLQTHGLMAGTRVASNLGWRAIEALAVGDQVLTFDNGMQEIVEIRRKVFFLDAPETDRAVWPMLVPVGAMGNREALTLLADQGVLIESDAASDRHGDPFAIVPAHTLDGVRGITRTAPARQIELIAVYFATDEVIYAEGGALIHCPTRSTPLDAMMRDVTPAYDVLDAAHAAHLAQAIVMEDRMMASGVRV
ncbi:Hint domain-containing protein [Sulfitobacter sp. JB4-11]|uniref:Hint domain-containing protein n=1 Tax=Sulfitobacter rhodophyticola TaxID=3238304 RepID=UPI003A680052